MTIETIDNVLYYVWRDGDELPKYQPIDTEAKSFRDNDNEEFITKYDWKRFYSEVIWPKLINDRAQHQLMIDEAFESLEPVLDKHACYCMMLDDIEHAENSNYNERLLQRLAYITAQGKRMMEYVQEQIDKEESK